VHKSVATDNVLGGLEREIVVGLRPTDFSANVSYTITADEARGILSHFIKYGYKTAN
jgi:hypothetical protein